MIVFHHRRAGKQSHNRGVIPADNKREIDTKVDGEKGEETGKEIRKSSQLAYSGP